VSLLAYSGSICLIEYSTSTEFVYQCEKLTDIGSCIVTNLLLFALEDGAFKAVKNLTDLDLLMRHTKSALQLSFEDSILGTPILRSYNPHQISRVSNASTWTVSTSRAMTYACLYNQIVKVGMRRGFQCWFCMRYFGGHLLTIKL
jgi:hypothetical protein